MIGNPGPVLSPCGNPITTTFNPGSMGTDSLSILLAGLGTSSRPACGPLERDSDNVAR